MSCHGYESVMLVLCTPLQVKCYQNGFTAETMIHFQDSSCNRRMQTKVKSKQTLRHTHRM